MHCYIFYFFLHTTSQRLRFASVDRPLSEMTQRLKMENVSFCFGPRLKTLGLEMLDSRTETWRGWVPERHY